MTLNPQIMAQILRPYKPALLANECKYLFENLARLRSHKIKGAKRYTKDCCIPPPKLTLIMQYLFFLSGASLKLLL